MGFLGFGKSSTLLWPGCYSSALLKDKVNNYKKIMKFLKIRYSQLDAFSCCGGFLINAGYDKEARKIARENFEQFKEKGIKKIITLCPLCYKTFAYDYPQMLPDWDIKIEFILTSILNQINTYYYLFEKSELGTITYADSCYLGRYSGIYDLPREILTLFGFELVELPNNRKNCLCSGSCGGLRQTNLGLANKIATTFLKQISSEKINKIVTADMHFYLHLKENCQEKNISILDFSDVLCDILHLRRLDS